VYEGEWKEAGSTGAIGETGYHWRTGIGESIRQKQASLTERNELVVLIKPLAATSYQNVINALDEMQINEVKKYAIVEPSAEERTYVQGAELSTDAQPGVTVK
jgi:predicted metal-dependent TIM-barrel fold hydrolase